MKALIEKYFEGETTLEEEARLRSYFNSGQVDEALKEYQPMFRFFASERKISVSGGFDEALLQKLEPQANVVKMRTWPRHLLRIAAVGAVLVAALVFLQKPNNGQSQQVAVDWSKYEITDEQVAYDETVKALRLLSSKLKKGSKKAADEVEKMEKVGKYFN
ncbi:MAG: hypothetical protein HY842_01440 [Bacteroidetes bacterium]|nr:hypothetical protein [Bacteroidota bacterium]